MGSPMKINHHSNTKITTVNTPRKGLALSRFNNVGSNRNALSPIVMT